MVGAGFLGHDRQRLGVAELELDAVGVGLRDDAFLIELHGGGKRDTEGDRIHAVLVHQEPGKGQRVDVVDADHRPEGVGRLVLEPAGGVPVLLAVDDGEVLFVDVGDASAGDGAAEAGLIGQQIHVAVRLG